jgi:hypothetical protein
MILGATPLELLGVNTADAGRHNPNITSPAPQAESSPNNKAEPLSPKIKTESEPKKPAQKMTSPKVKSSPS